MQFPRPFRWVLFLLRSAKSASSSRERNNHRACYTYFDRAPNSMSCKSMIPANLVLNCAYSASESVRTSKKTFGVVGDSRIVFNDIPSVLDVLNAKNPKRWTSMR